MSGSIKKVMIQNLNFKTDEKAIREHFGQFSKITKVQIIKDGNNHSKGQAIVTFADPNAATHCIQTFNKTTFERKTISLELFSLDKPKQKPKKSQPKPSQTKSKTIEVKEQITITKKIQVKETKSRKPTHSPTPKKLKK